MLVLNALRGDSKLKMGDGKGWRGSKNAKMLRKLIIIQNAISLFPICFHFEILNNTQT